MNCIYVKVDYIIADLCLCMQWKISKITVISDVYLQFITQFIYYFTG